MTDQVTDHLNVLVADYQVLYQKLRSYHWNVTGREFFTLHPVFEEHYNTVAERVDALAERIRALGATPPSTYRQQLEIARLEEDDTIPDGEEMVRRIVADYERLQTDLRDAIELSEKDEDFSTASMLEDFITEQAKSLWMLQSFLGETLAIAQPLARPKAL